MSLSVRSRNRWLSRFLAVSLCLQTWVVVGASRTFMVVAGAGWNSALSSKAQPCFMGGLQTLVEFALNFCHLWQGLVAKSVAAGVPAKPKPREGWSPAGFRAADTVATSETASALGVPNIFAIRQRPLHLTIMITSKSTSLRKLTAWRASRSRRDIVGFANCLPIGKSG